MKCNLVRDLLPLYLEELCEEETQKQIKDHLDGCEECRQLWKDMGSPVERMIEEVENEVVSIEPMKKYQKKIKRKNRMLVLVVVLAVIVIGVLAYLSYGQIKQTGQSFETISQYVRFRHIGKEFADGNTDPLLSALAIVDDDPEYAYYVRNAYGDNEDAYIQDIREYINERYAEYFQGKSLKLRKVMVQYHTNLVYQTRNLLVVLVYKIDGIEYYIRLERKGGDKYYVAQDDFAVSVEPVTYTQEETDAETEKTDSDTEQEAVSPLLDTQESLFQALPPFDNQNFFIARRAVRNGYQECRQSGETLSPAVFMTSLLYTTEECLKDASLLIDYHKSMWDQAEKIIQQKYWIQDIRFNVLSYDKEEHIFRYRVSLSLIQVETEEECELTVECYRHLSKLVVIPGTEKLIGENIPEDAKTAMLDLWKIR